MDIGSIAGVASSLKTAGDIAKAMIGLRDAATVQAKVIELQGVILAAQGSALTAQSDQMAMLERVRDLEAEVARLKAWDAEKQRYELKDMGRGTLAYALKAEAKGTGPDHSLCAQCYEEGVKSILQAEIRFPGRCHVLACHRCGSALYTTGAWEKGHPSPRSSR
jgi:hypothetical protein